jgi:hypothetical protein
MDEEDVQAALYKNVVLKYHPGDANQSSWARKPNGLLNGPYTKYMERLMETIVNE